MDWPEGKPKNLNRTATKTKKLTESTKKNETDSRLPHFLNRWNMIRAKCIFDECALHNAHNMCQKRRIGSEYVSVWWINIYFSSLKFQYRTACMLVFNAVHLQIFRVFTYERLFLWCIRKTGKDINLNRKVFAVPCDLFICGLAKAFSLSLLHSHLSISTSPLALDGWQTLDVVT